jgi:hypothetical protein
MQATRQYITTVVPALLAFGFLTFNASAKATTSTDIVIQLRVTGDSETRQPVRSCLVEKLSQMPDVKVATASTDGTRFVVDVVAAKNADRQISASVVVAEIFPIEQFQPRIKEGEDAKALLTSIQYYTLLRLHEVVPARSHKPLCLSVAADIGDIANCSHFNYMNETNMREGAECTSVSTTGSRIASFAPMSRSRTAQFLLSIGLSARSRTAVNACPM